MLQQLLLTLVRVCKILQRQLEQRYRQKQRRLHHVHPNETRSTTKLKNQGDSSKRKQLTTARHQGRPTNCPAHQGEAGFRARQRSPELPAPEPAPAPEHSLLCSSSS